MTPREEAISDCNYAKSLGNIALSEHLFIWGSMEERFDLESKENQEYYLAIVEIYDKLNTPECLLEK